MKIGIYNPRAGVAKSGGTETFLREMIDRISGEHSIKLYTGQGQLLDSVSKLGIDIQQFPYWKKEGRKNQIVSRYTPALPAEVESISMFKNFRDGSVIKKINEEVDVISTHYYLDNILISRSGIDIPTIFRFPGIKHDSIRWKLMAKVAKTDIYVSNSASTRERINKWLDIDDDGIVYAGVDLDQFCPNTTPAINSSRPVIMFIGRLDDGKGLKDLLYAFSQLDGNPILYIIGEGTLAEELQELTRELDIEHEVEFPGAIPHKEIHHYYAAADIFCLPSYHEGFPVVNMEAMAMGLPVLSTRIDAVKEQINHGKEGLLVPPGDIDSLSKSLNKLLNNPGMRSELGSRGRLKAESDFAWEKQSKNMIKIYENAVNHQ